MEAGQLFAQLRKELHGVARDLYLYYLYEKIEDKKIIECKNHQMIKESYVKIRALEEKIIRIGELLGIDQASCPIGELDNKKPL